MNRHEEPMNYQRFAMLPELLSLQRPISDPPEHDEMLFIIVHQVHELWFKAVLHELDRARELLMAGDEARAAATLKRVRSIVKVLVGQLDILETMTPVEFESFRDRLETASGFQSAQFRELEFALGIKRAAVLRTFPDPDEHGRLNRRLAEPSLWDAFLRFLVHKGYEVPERVLGRDPAGALKPDPEVQRVLVDAYRADPATVNLCELLVDLDEGFQEWRYRHLKMTERTIGNKRGTGDSAGVAYLATTIKPAFPDLWEMRMEL
ncbi:MAG: tryptophan 2,3-dioxygenase family protein [Gemmatimonadota bacterium]|nr:tryptophan 2,3-dioxygenase family protein [Gemmatimonadota bacterium]